MDALKRSRKAKEVPARSPKADRIYENDRAFDTLCEMVLAGRRLRKRNAIFKEMAKDAKILYIGQVLIPAGLL